MMPTAQWVWLPEETRKENSFVEFRKWFEVTSAVTTSNCTVHVAARNEYIVYVNGHIVGRGPSPCDAAWQYYDSYDISEYIQAGTNVIAVVCYHFGTNDIIIDQFQGAAGLWLQLDTNDQPWVQTDSSWKCRRSPRWGDQTKRISHWGGFNEIYKVAMEDGWQFISYDDSLWLNAAVIAEARDPESPWPRLIPREIPYLHYETISPTDIVRTEMNLGSITNHTRVDASKPGSLPGIVYDFGKEVVGRPMLVVEAPAGGVIRIAYGESLELQYVDAFVLREGHNELKPFGRRACRYMQLSIMATPEPILLRKVQFELTHYPYQAEGKLSSGDPLLDQIWEISKYTTLMNSHDHLEDCPWREKALWVVDAVVMGKIIYNTYGDTALMRKCLLQGARIQNEDGSIPGTGPERNHMLLPDFCAYWLIGVSDYVNYSGDLDFLSEIWINATQVIDWFEQQCDETGLFAGASRPGWWCFIDWTEDVDKRDKVSSISFLYYKALNLMSELAARLGKSEAEKTYQKRSIRLYHDIREKLWLPEKSLFADCMDGDQLSSSVSLQTNFHAIWCGLMTKAEADYFLKEVYFKAVLPPVRGPFFQHIVLEVLMSLDKHTESIELIKSYWGEMLSRGATTWWETFDASTPHCTIPSPYQGNTPTYLWEAAPVSLCHAWSASPAYILTRLILGADVSNLGNGELMLEVPRHILTSCQGELPTRYGTVKIAWERGESGIHGRVSLPAGIIMKEPVDDRINIERGDEIV